MMSSDPLSFSAVSEHNITIDEAALRLVHLHFGAGRLGLGLIAPFFQTPGSALYSLNRAVPAHNDTDCTALSSHRRDALLRDHPDKHHIIAAPGAAVGKGEAVRYDGFFTYEVLASITTFSKRLTDRVDPPMRAFETAHGAAPPAATHSVQSLLHLLASGSFIDAKVG